MNEYTPKIMVEINGRRFEFSPIELIRHGFHKASSNIFHIKKNDQLFSIEVLEFNRTTSTCTLSVNGHIKEIKILRDIDQMIERMGLNKTFAKAHVMLSAPMPGLVSGIKVHADQKVEKGSPLIILEAMKMENVMTAPHDVTIKQIFVSVGQAVEKGISLIEFYPHQKN